MWIVELHYDCLYFAFSYLALKTIEPQVIKSICYDSNIKCFYMIFEIGEGVNI